MQLLTKHIFLLSIIFCTSFSIKAQGTFSNDADAPKIKEIQIAIVTLVQKAVDNFSNQKGNLLVTYKANDKWVTTYQPNNLSMNMYANDASITEENETKKYFYEATYNNNRSIKIAYNASLIKFPIVKLIYKMTVTVLIRS